MIKNIVLLVIFILGIVILQYVRSRSIGEIINKYLEARGGRYNLNAVRSIYMEGSREILGTKAAIKITTVQGKLSRTDFEIEGNTGFSMVTPTVGWSLIPIRSLGVESIPPDRLDTMQEQLDIAGPLVDYAAKGNKAELEGKEFISGREAYKIKMTLNTGKEVFYYIDKETSLLVQSKQVIIDNEKEHEIITNYSNYVSVEGILFPQTISNPAVGIMGGTTTFDTIIINKLIDESQYKPLI